MKRNLIIQKDNIIDLDKICDEELPEPDILIETKYWKLLKYKVKYEQCT